MWTKTAFRSATAASAVIGILAVAGCTTTKKVPGPTRTVTKTATRTVAPTITTWTVKEAGQHYLALVKKSNSDLTAGAKVEKTNSLPKIRKACRTLADDDDAFIRGLANGHWPKQVQSAIDALELAIARERGDWLASSKAKTIDQYNAIKIHFDTGQAERVRVLLGLPGTK